jgi:hypothetical protein
MLLRRASQSRQARACRRRQKSCHIEEAHFVEAQTAQRGADGTCRMVRILTFKSAFEVEPSGRFSPTFPSTSTFSHPTSQMMMAVSRLGQLHARLSPRVLQPVSASAGVFVIGHGRQQFRARSCKSSQRERPLSLTSPGFWGATQTWKRAGVNTSRCLIGCSLGDFSAMWYLQAFHPEIGMESIMAISSSCPPLLPTRN